MQSWPGRLFNLAMIILVVISTFVWLLDTNKELNASYANYFHALETFCMIAFTIEYALRFIAFDGNRLRYVVKPMALIDLLAILPFYVAPGTDTAFLRILRLFRIFRVFKLARYSSAMDKLIWVFKENASILGLFLFIVSIILLISAAIMHTIEPARFGQMTDAFWWAIVTMTTVGYGDIIPETLAGKFVAGIIMILGIGIIALPTGILGASLTKMVSIERENPNLICSRCGEHEHLTVARFCHRCGERIVNLESDEI